MAAYSVGFADKEWCPGTPILGCWDDTESGYMLVDGNRQVSLQANMLYSEEAFCTYIA